MTSPMTKMIMLTKMGTNLTGLPICLLEMPIVAIDYLLTNLIVS